MRQLLNDEMFSDVKFLIAKGYMGEGRVIHGHMCVLLSHFANIFEVHSSNTLLWDKSPYAAH